MQIVIMAAGRGQRIREISRDMPKGFLEINEEPLIDIVLNKFIKKNLRDIIIVVGYKKEMFEAHLIDKNIKFVHNPFYDAGQVLSSFWFALPFINNNQDLIFCHADTIYEDDILDDLIKTPGDIVMSVSETAVDEEAMKFILSNDKSHIIRVSKDISIEKAQGEFIGLCKISSKVLSSLKKKTTELISNSDNRIRCYFEDALQLLYTQEGYIIRPCYTNENKWVEIDDVIDYKRALTLF